MIYDMSKSFHENIAEDFRFNGLIPARCMPPEHEWVNIFDYKIMSRIGLSSCPLSATPQGVALASKLGFDVITCKTIRSKASEPYLAPNLTHVFPAAGLEKTDMHMIATSEYTKSFANSIGNPSYELEPTLEKIKKSLNSLQKGQMLIASIYGTGQTEKEIIDDFVSLAQRVNETGVHAIELNCSCPNVVNGLYYKNIDFMQDLMDAVFRVVSVPIIIKVSHADSYEQLQDLLRACAKAGVRGVAGINTIGMPVLNQDGTPFFGPTRLFGAISGDAILQYGLKWVQDARMIIKADRLDLIIFGGGGITTAEKFDQFFDASADVCMTATGALLDPMIAMNYHEKKYLILDRNRTTIQAQTKG